MSRLIDADALIKDFKLLINKSFLGEITVSTQISIGEVASLIGTQPTAYDVEAVVRELEAEYEWAADTFHGHNGLHELGQLKAYDNAIRIVKRGGRNE